MNGVQGVVRLPKDAVAGERAGAYHSPMETRTKSLADRPGANRSGSIAVLATSATICLALLAGVSPQALEAQDAGPQAQAPPTASPTVSVDDELLGAAARVHLQVTNLQKAFIEELARFHDAGEKAAARARFSARMAEILEAHEMTAAQYELVLFVIGTDEEKRTRFDGMLDRIKAEQDGVTDA